QVIDPWLAGDALGVQRVEYIFKQVIVRHKLHEIQNETPLPPLTERTIHLSMNDHERININLIIAQIKLNSLLSEREGKDYFGDASQRDALHEVVSNLRLSLFHFNGSEIITHATNSLRNATTGLILASTGAKLYNPSHLSTIISHLQSSQDQFYAAQQVVGDVLYVVKECPCLWRCGGVVGDGMAVVLVDFRGGRRLMTKVQVEAHVKELKSVKRDWEWSADMSVDSAPPAVQADVDPEPLHKKKRLKVSFADDLPSNDASSVPATSDSVQPTGSEVAPSKGVKPTLCQACQLAPELSFEIEATTCTKLTYIGDQILKHHKTEKIIVYTTHDNEMHAVKEFCELFQIGFRMFMKTHNKNTEPQQRMSEKSVNVTTFNTSDQIRVIIMEISKSAFGLDLSSASRIYFIRPVTETAVYKQAIKRAHRLGCTRPVHVEVVAFLGTLETDVQVLQHEGLDAAGGGSGSKMKKVDVADLKMKDVIDVAPFVHSCKGDGVNVGGLPDLFSPRVSFSAPFLKRI
ncbi:hypothetical protein HDU98_002474, partial [Podochytrium sp. JEL0797]